MLRIGKLTDYAILAMTEMAVEPDRVFSASELAGRTHLEQTTVAKLLKALTKSGLIRSYRGARGGYRLGRQPGDITVAEIIAAMEGPIGMTECSVHRGMCSREAVCTTRSNWRRISQAVELALNDVSLLDMTQPIVSPIDIGRMRLVNG